MTIICLTRVSKREQADGIKRILDGKTYMKFRVLVCPVGGEFVVNAETDYQAEDDEIKDFLLSVLASEVK